MRGGTTNFSSLLIGLFLFAAASASAQITLTDQKTAFQPQEFFVADVVDERLEKSSLGLMVSKDPTGKLSIKAIDLKGGAEKEIERYLTKNYTRNRGSRASVLGIKELHLSESSRTDGMVEGRIRVHFSLGLQKPYGVEPLVSTQYALNYRRPVANTSSIEGHLRKLFEKALSHFDEWIKENANSDSRLAREVRISFSDYKDAIEGDTIYYSPNRPLKWADFQSKNIRVSKYDAVVIPSIGFIQEARAHKSVVYVEIAMKAYLPKSAAWVRSSAMSYYTLNHEQRHFDIVRIISEQFKQKVRSANLTPDNYLAFLNMQHLDSLRDLHKMQKAYDDETSHGLNLGAQEKWNKKIDEELKSIFLASK